MQSMPIESTSKVEDARDRGKHALGTMWRNGKLLSYDLRHKLSNKRRGGIAYKYSDTYHCTAKKHGKFGTMFHGNDVKKHLENKDNHDCYSKFMDWSNAK